MGVSCAAFGGVSGERLRRNESRSFFKEIRRRARPRWCTRSRSDSAAGGRAAAEVLTHVFGPRLQKKLPAEL